MEAWVIAFRDRGMPSRKRPTADNLIDAGRIGFSGDSMRKVAAGRLVVLTELGYASRMYRIARQEFVTEIHVHFDKV